MLGGQSAAVAALSILLDHIACVVESTASRLWLLLISNCSACSIVSDCNMTPLSSCVVLRANLPTRFVLLQPVGITIITSSIEQRQYCGRSAVVVDVKEAQNAMATSSAIAAWTAFCFRKLEACERYEFVQLASTAYRCVCGSSSTIPLALNLLNASQPSCSISSC